MWVKIQSNIRVFSWKGNIMGLIKFYSIITVGKALYLYIPPGSGLGIALVDQQ